MPRRPPSTIVLAALVLAIAVGAVLLTRRVSPYVVDASFQDAGQLVKGNQIRIAGNVVGTVERIDLDDRGRARLRLRVTDRAFHPLHEGTRAIIRNSSLSSVAGRFVVLEPGPNDAAAIPDGGRLATDDTRSTTDIDELLNAFDSRSMDAIQRLAVGGADALDGAGAATNDLLRRLSPAVRRTGELTSALTADTPALEQLVTTGATTAAAFADRRSDLTSAIATTATTLHATADRRAQLAAALRRAPVVLTRASETFGELRGLISDARPTFRRLQAVVPPLSAVLREVPPLATDAAPLLRDLRATVPSLTDSLERAPALAAAGVPALRETTAALRGLRAPISDLRAYTPDVVHGLVIGFGGKAASLYDANGHIGRLQPVINMATLPAAASALDPLLGPVTSLLGANLTQYTTRNVNRCPGSATQAAADGSNPWPVGGCDVRQVPPGGTP